MPDSNRTFSDHTHRIFLAPPKHVSDRTGLYIIFLLFILLFILIFYLFYNFISFKRYSYSRKNSKNKKTMTTTKKNYSEKKFNDRLTIVLAQSIEDEKIKRVHSFEELIIPSHHIPLQITTPLFKHQCSKQMKKSISNQYHITNQLVSDL